MEDNKLYLLPSQRDAFNKAVARTREIHCVPMDTVIISPVDLGNFEVEFRGTNPVLIFYLGQTFGQITK